MLELIIEIIMVSLKENLKCFEDYLRFSDFCRVVRSFSVEVKLCQKPWVMLGNKAGEKSRPFYSPLEGTIYNVKLPKVVRRSWCCGSYEGWLIMAHKTRGNFIYNPITRQRFRLPTLQIANADCYGYPFEIGDFFKRRPTFLTKVVLSSVPFSSNSPLLAAAITANYKVLVTICSPGLDNKWHHFCSITLEEEEGLIWPELADITFIHGDEETGEDKDEEEEIELSSRLNGHFDEMEITDIIFYKGKFYAVNNNGKLIVFNVVNGQDFSLEKVQMAPFNLKRKELLPCNMSYLVESCHGELLLVVRIRDRVKREWITREETTKFVVFKLVGSSGEPFRWVRMEALGEQVLFLGQNYSKSISSCNIQVPLGNSRAVRENCIYFTDSHTNHYYNYHWTTKAYEGLGVYHLNDGHIDKLLPTELDHHLFVFMCQPILFTPNPC